MLVSRLRKCLPLVLPLALISLMMLPVLPGEARSVHKRFTIHVPLPIRTHHHTHTVYSHIRNAGTKQTVYKVLGYSSQGPGRPHAHGEVSYDDAQCCEGHGQGDIVFNHYSRHDEEYPEMETYIDDEQGDVWT